MLRIANSFKVLNITKDILNNDCYVLNFYSIRWRKPRWVPKAKSKLFKVPPRTITPEDELIELRRLTNNYNTQIKSIRRFLTEKSFNISMAQTDPEELKRQFEQDFVQCMQLNNKWNEEQMVLREQREADKLEAELDFAKERVKQELKKREENMQLVEEIVRREKELSKSYITAENIDVAIEHALANPVDYNFAIDLRGEKIIDYEHEQKEKPNVNVN